MPQGQGDYYIYAIPTPGELGQTEVRYQYVAVPKPVQAAPAATQPEPAAATGTTVEPAAPATAPAPSQP